MKRPFLLYILLALHIFLGIGAVAGGGLLLLQPDGSMLGMDPAWLIGSPFDTYLIPGFVLFTFNGLLPLFAAVGLLLKPDWSWPNALNIYADRHWAWTYSLYCGIIIITWITVQLVMTRYFWLQPVMIFTGLFIVIITLTPPLIKHYTTTQQRFDT